MGKYDVTISVVGRETFTVNASSEDKAIEAAKGQYNDLIAEGYRLDGDLDVRVESIKRKDYDREFVKYTAIEMWSTFKNFIRLLGIDGFWKEVGNPKADYRDFIWYILTEIMHRDDYAEHLRQLNQDMDPVCAFMFESKANPSCIGCPMNDGVHLCDYRHRLDDALNAGNPDGCTAVLSDILEKLYAW